MEFNAWWGQVNAFIQNKKRNVHRHLQMQIIKTATADTNTDKVIAIITISPCESSEIKSSHNNVLNYKGFIVRGNILPSGISHDT